MNLLTNQLKNFKYSLILIGRTLNYKIACWQGFCPTAEELENDAVKSLSKRLEGQSHKETLTNILDWEGRNIEFWTERHPLVTFLVNFLLWSLIIGGLAFFGLIVFVVLSYHSWELLSSYATWFVAIFITILMTGSAVIFALIIKLIHSNRKIPMLEALKNGFAKSININFYLENKLGICRDSAKLTASLLLNIYPKSEVYFAFAPGHVATGIVIENKLYMLDQRLPILTIDGWKKYRHLNGKLHKLGNKNIETVDPNRFLSQNTNLCLNHQYLADTITKLLKIEQRNKEKGSTVRIKLLKGAILYPNDELVIYSISVWLKARLSEELIELSQVTEIEVNIEKEDMIFFVHLG